MRFAALTMPTTEPPRSPAVEFVRRLVGADNLPRSTPEVKPVEAKQADPPMDLDQRVRLAGEW